MLASAFDSSDHRDALEAVVLLDEDDNESLALAFAGLSVVRLVCPQMSMGSRVLTCVEHATGEILILANDDLSVRTKGWDSRIRGVAASYPDGVFLLYPDDGFKGATLPTFPIVSKEFFTVCSPEFWRFYQGAFLDVDLFEIFQRLRQSGQQRIHYLGDVLFEHEHYRTGKSAWDDTYARRNRFGDDATFASLVPYRKATAIRLLKQIEGIETPEASAFAIQPRPIPCLGYPFHLLFDRGLPAVWRIRLAAWYFARQLYRAALSVKPAVLRRGARRSAGRSQSG